MRNIINYKTLAVLAFAGLLAAGCNKAAAPAPASQYGSDNSSGATAGATANTQTNIKGNIGPDYSPNGMPGSQNGHYSPPSEIDTAPGSAPGMQ